MPGAEFRIINLSSTPENREKAKDLSRYKRKVSALFPDKIRNIHSLILNREMQNLLQIRN
jgi:hypothetical protein